MAGGCLRPKRKPTHGPTAFWLTQLEPSTHAPRSLGAVTFSQVVLDLPDPDILSRILRMQGAWNAFRCTHPDHPTVRALAAAGIDYATTGYAVLSLCIPPTCCFAGRPANNLRLLTMYRKARHLPAHTLPVTVRNGLFLGGVLTSDTLTGAHGLLGHIYHHHGPAAGLRFIDTMQRLTTSVSMYAYCPSIGLDDCLLRPDVRATARRVLARSVADTILVPPDPCMDVPPPYRVDGNDSPDVETGRLVSIQVKSEAMIMQHTLGEHTRHAAWSPVAPIRMNQIALLCMLGTKGSVSNLIQCCHSVGQQIIQDERLSVADYDRVFPQDPKFPLQGCSAESGRLLWNVPSSYTPLRAGKPSWSARRAPRSRGTPCVWGSR